MAEDTKPLTKRLNALKVDLYDVGAFRPIVPGTLEKEPLLCFSNIHAAARVVEPAAVSALLKTYELCQEKKLNIQSTIEYHKNKANFEELKDWYYTQCGLETRDSQLASVQMSRLRTKTLGALNILLDFYDQILKYIDNSDVELAYFFVRDQYYNIFLAALNLINKSNQKQHGVILEITHIEIVMGNLKQCLSQSLQRVLRKQYVVWDEKCFIINFDIFFEAELKKGFLKIGSAWYQDTTGTLKPSLTQKETNFYQSCFNKAVAVKNNFRSETQAVMSDGGKGSITEKSKTAGFEQNFQMLMQFKAVYEEIRAIMRPVRIRYRIYKKDQRLRANINQELKEIYALQETIRTNLYLEHFGLTAHLERPETYSTLETQANNRYYEIVTKIQNLVAKTNATDVRRSNEDIKEGEKILFEIIQLKKELIIVSRAVLKTLSQKRQEYFNTIGSLGLDQNVIDALRSDDGLNSSSATQNSKTTDDIQSSLQLTARSCPETSHHEDSQPPSMKPDSDTAPSSIVSTDVKTISETQTLDSPSILQEIYELCEARKRHYQQLPDYYKNASVEELQNWYRVQFFGESPNQVLSQNRAQLLSIILININDFCELYNALIRYIDELDLEKAFFCVRLKYLQIIFKTPSAKDKLQNRDENVELSNLKFMMDNLRQCLNQPVRRILKKKYLVWDANFSTIDFPRFYEHEIAPSSKQFSKLKDSYSLTTGQRKYILSDDELQRYQTNHDKAVALEVAFREKMKRVLYSSKEKAKQHLSHASWIDSFETQYETLLQFRVIYVEVRSLMMPIRERYAIFSKDEEYKDDFRHEIEEMNDLSDKIKEKLHMNDSKLGLHLNNPENYSKDEKNMHMCYLIVRVEINELIDKINSKPTPHSDKDFEEAENLFIQCKTLKAKLKRVTQLILKSLKEKTKEFNQAVTFMEERPFLTVPEKQKGPPQSKGLGATGNEEQKETTEEQERKKALERKAKRLNRVKPTIKEIDEKDLVQKMHALSERQLHERSMRVSKMAITSHIRELFTELYQYQFTRAKLNHLVTELKSIGENIQIISSGGSHSTLKIGTRQGCFSATDADPTASAFNESGKLFGTHARKQKAKKNNALLSDIDIENILWVFYRSGYLPKTLAIKASPKFDASKFTSHLRGQTYGIKS